MWSIDAEQFKYRKRQLWRKYQTDTSTIIDLDVAERQMKGSADNQMTYGLLASTKQQ